MTRSTLLKTFLDTPAEVHAATHGIYAGMTEWKGTEMPDNVDVAKEPHYYKGGYIIGTLIRWTAILLLGSSIL